MDWNCHSYGHQAFININKIEDKIYNFFYCMFINMSSDHIVIDVQSNNDMSYFDREDKTVACVTGVICCIIVSVIIYYTEYKQYNEF